ncbi:unnamed protein product, partial [marine sediment metagenome]
EAFVKKTSGGAWGTKVKKVKIENNAPKAYGFIGWNMTNDFFKDKKVRIALTHLMNRAEMIEKFRYGLSLPATGPWYQQSPYADTDVKPIPYDPKKAQELLNQAGWHDNDKNGILEKKFNDETREFKFTLLFVSKDSEKYLTHYKQDLAKVGIEMELKRLEWNSFVKLLDEKKFEAITLAWGPGSVDNDPKQIWHSSSAQTGGSNFISYNNPKVDKLIEEGRKLLKREERIKVWKKVYRAVAEDAPYLFLFNKKFELYAHADRIKRL